MISEYGAPAQQFGHRNAGIVACRPTRHRSPRWIRTRPNLSRRG
ncbi:hypothetical protein C7S13_1090 [Burkholderia cepacia]|nr:hypothetical protein [Burkholderia cepacia]